MPLTLTTPTAISDTVNSFKITSFAVDLERLEIYVAYNELNASNQVIAEKTMTIVEPDFTTALTTASAEASYDVYLALKNSLYTQLQSQTGQTGAVV